MIAYLDTETTGLPEDEDARVVEIGIAVFDDNGILVRSLESLVLPDKLTQAGLDIALRISQITLEDLENEGREPEELWPEIGALLDDWTIPVVCWNLEFDQLMWRRTFCALDPKKAEQHDRISWGLCAMLSFSRTFKAYATTWNGQPGRLSLRSAVRICANQGQVVVWPGESHRALPDAVVTGRIDYLHRQKLVTAVELPVTGAFVPKESSGFRTMPKTGTFEPT
jgi:hypothetical protein